MAEPFIYAFEWDPAKAAENTSKHDVAIETAATVFRDPHMLTVYDTEHSEEVERWASVGRAEDGRRNRRNKRHGAHNFRARGNPARTPEL